MSDKALDKAVEIANGLDPLKMRTPGNGDFFTPILVNRIGDQTYARC